MIHLNSKPVLFKIDTEGDVSVITVMPETAFKHYKECHVKLNCHLVGPGLNQPKVSRKLCYENSVNLCSQAAPDITFGMTWHAT